MPGRNSIQIHAFTSCDQTNYLLTRIQSHTIAPSFIYIGLVITEPDLVNCQELNFTSYQNCYKSVKITFARTQPAWLSTNIASLRYFQEVMSTYSYCKVLISLLVSTYILKTIVFSKGKKDSVENKFDFILELIKTHSAQDEFFFNEHVNNGICQMTRNYEHLDSTACCNTIIYEVSLKCSIELNR